jgi:Ca2+-binding EF-hand superfamily protein
MSSGSNPSKGATPPAASRPTDTTAETKNTLTEADEAVIRLALKNAARREKRKKREASEGRRRRREKCRLARDAKKKSESELARAAEAKASQRGKPRKKPGSPKKRLSMFERTMKKRYGAYEEGVGEFMHKDEGNARPIAKLLDVLVDRIHRRQRGRSRVESFKLFLPDMGGASKITKTSLAAGIQACGCSFTAAECDRVFKQVDKNGDGDIDFQEFVTVLMGDKPQMLTNISSSVLDKLTAAQKRSLTLLRHMGQDGKGNRWAISEAKRVLAQKIKQKVSGGGGQVRHAFRYFQDSLDKSGVTFGSFCHGLRSVGMVVPEDMQWALYNAFDANGDGVITYQEFHDAYHNMVDKLEQTGARAGTGASARVPRSDPAVSARPTTSAATGRSEKSQRSQATMKRIQQLGLLRPRTAAHHKARVTKGLPGVKAPYKPPKIVNKPTRHRWQDKLNRKWDLHASNKYVHRSQPFSERLR